MINTQTATDQLYGEHNDGLEWECPVAQIKQVFQCWAKQFQHQSVVLTTRSEVVDVWKAICNIRCMSTGLLTYNWYYSCFMSCYTDTLDIALFTCVTLKTSSDLQSQNWQLIDIKRIMRPSTAHTNRQLDLWCSYNQYTTALTSHTLPSYVSYYSLPILIRAGSWSDLSTQ